MHLKAQTSMCFAWWIPLLGPRGGQRQVSSELRSASHELFTVAGWVSKRCLAHMTEQFGERLELGWVLGLNLEELKHHVSRRLEIRRRTSEALLEPLDAGSQRISALQAHEHKVVRPQ